MKTRTLLPCSITVGLLTISSLQAATVDWSSTAGTTAWATGANWVGSAAPANDLVTDLARFDQASYTNQPGAPSGRSVGGLIFGNNSTSTPALTITTQTNTNRLNVGASGISIRSQSGAISLGGASSTAGIQLGASQSWINNSSSLLTVNTVSGQTVGQDYTLTLGGSGTGGITITGAVLNSYSGTDSGSLSLIINNSGGGVTTLSAANSFWGTTTLTSGVLALGHESSVSGSALDTTGSGTMTLSGSNRLFTGGLSGSRNISTVMTSGYGSVANLFLTQGIASTTLTYSGVISNGAASTGITKAGAGTQIFEGANSYSGGTTINGGVLGVTSLGNASAPSTLGASTTASGNLILNGGTLRLTGSTTSAQSTNRMFTINSNGGTLDSSAGVGSSMNFTGSGTYGMQGPGHRTLTLTGSRNGSLAGIIEDQTAVTELTSVTKTGNGTWTLNGANTYTGITTVSAGTLMLGASGSIASSRLDVQGGTFDASAAASLPNFTELRGAGTFNAGGKTITLAAAGILVPGNSAGQLTLQSGLDISAVADSGGLQFELGSDATAGSTYDTVSLSSSTLTLGTLNFADFTFATLSGFDTGIYTLFDAGTISGSISSASGTVGGLGATLSFSGNDVILTVVPEPRSGLLMACGLSAFLIFRRRRSF